MEILRPCSEGEGHENAESEKLTNDEVDESPSRTCRNLEKLFDQAQLQQNQQKYYAGLYTVLLQMKDQKMITDEAAAFIGLYIGLGKADQYFAVCHQGSWHQIASVDNFVFKRNWSLKGWIIKYAPPGSMEVIQHHPCILKEVYIGLGIEPSDDNEDESESEPMSSDDDSNAESFLSLDSYRS